METVKLLFSRLEVSMVFDVIIAFFINVLLLLSMSFIQQTIPEFKRKYIKPLVVGLYSGLVGLVLMTNTFEFYEGMIFDTRSILVSSTALFFGAIPASITWLFLISYRLYLGGSGVLAAFINITQATVLGLLYRKLKIKNSKVITLTIKDMLLISYVIHIIMFLLVFTLPIEERNQILPHLWYMVLIILPLSSLLINLFHKYQINLNTKKESIIQYQELFENSHVVLMILDPIDGRIIDVNKTALAFYGWKIDEITKMTIHDINILSKEEIKKKIELCLQQEKAYFNFKHRTKSGAIIDVEVYSGPIKIDDREVLLSTVIDATDKIKNKELILERQKQLEYIGYHDHLTGLYSRGFFDIELKRLHNKRQLPLSVIFIDVNELKKLNDTVSHLEGDKLLIEVANAIKRSVRDTDIVSRWGGDEFAILLPQTNEHSVKSVIQRIKLECKKSKLSTKPSVSIGYHTQRELSNDVNQALRIAEEEMYKRKRSSKKR